MKSSTTQKATNFFQNYANICRSPTTFLSCFSDYSVWILIKIKKEFTKKILKMYCLGLVGIVFLYKDDTNESVIKLFQFYSHWILQQKEFWTLQYNVN